MGGVNTYVSHPVEMLALTRTRLLILSVVGAIFFFDWRAMETTVHAEVDGKTARAGTSTLRKDLYFGGSVQGKQQSFFWGCEDI